MRIYIVFAGLCFMVPNFLYPAFAQSAFDFDNQNLSENSMFAGCVFGHMVESSRIPTASDASQVGPVARIQVDIGEICQGKGLCFLDSYVPLRGSEDKGLNFLQEFLQSLTDYANPLSSEEKGRIDYGLKYLQRTTLGKELCSGLAGGICTVDALESKGIIVRSTDKMEMDYPAKTLLWGGEVVIVINSQPKYAVRGGVYWAVYLGHELSHADDYKKFKYDMTESHRADSEIKAFLGQMYMYNELKPIFPGSVDIAIMDFMIRLWAWKENSGPYPPDFYEQNGHPYRAQDFIKNYVGPVKSGVACIENVVTNYIYDDLPHVTTLNPDDKVRLEISRNRDMWGVGYSKWRTTHPELAFPPFPNQIKPPQEGGVSGGGGTGSGGGGWVPPTNPNPGFTPGGGAIY